MNGGQVTQEGVVALTAIGVDRPGIVAGITKVLFDLGCNLEDTSSTILRGHFCMMLIVATPPVVDAAVLEERLAPVGRDLAVVITARPVEPADPVVSVPTHLVSVYGSDHPGIVFRVCDWLARAGANVVDLTSRVIGSKERPVYVLILEVSAPTGLDIESGLGELKDELGVDISVRPVPADIL